MFTYKRLNEKHNAKIALRELLASGVAKANLAFAIYHLGENHIECASDEGGPQVGQKYQLSRETANAIKSDATNHFNHALLAYDMRTNSVYLLDAAPELAVCNCLLLCVMNILLGIKDSYAPSRMFEDETPHTPIENYVTAQPRPNTKVVRDAQTGRFMRLEEDHSNDDGVVGTRFRLGRFGV